MNSKTLHQETPTWVEIYRRVDVCKKCQGQGRISVFTGRGKDDEYGEEVCHTCRGSGMVKKELTVKIFPYDNRKDHPQ